LRWRRIRAIGKHVEDHLARLRWRDIGPGVAFAAGTQVVNRANPQTGKSVERIVLQTHELIGAPGESGARHLSIICLIAAEIM
jgi:hypothetical protein